MKIVPDTGALIDGRITQLLENEKAKALVVVHQSVVAELEFQANSGREIGFTGLDELKKLSKLSKEGKIELQFYGQRPSDFDIDRARFGEIDSKIRECAQSLGKGAVLYTTDKVQTSVAQAEGLEVKYFEPVVSKVELSFEKFFAGGDVLSLHVKEDCPARIKAGKPGNFALKDFSSKIYSSSEIEDMAKQAVEFSRREKKGFIEIDKKGALVVQARDYRVTFTKPPFSEAFEITIVKPLVKFSLEDYRLDHKLLNRIDLKAEGILIAGPPGSGKSTFASALAQHYSRKNKIVKTLEQPRDLQLSPEITQYAPLEGSFEASSDILLLVRPDYTVFDEVRKPLDFKVFADLRMAGIGMVGVVHASKPIDAVQRFIGKIELGMIPHVIDTVLFVDRGGIAKTFSLSLVVRNPFGMSEKDLARPVIEVRDLESSELEYEIYKYGDETIVISIKDAVKSKYQKKFERGRGNAESENQEEFGRQVVLDRRAHKIISSFVREYEAQARGDRITLLVPEGKLASVIGKGGARVVELEKKLGCRVDVRAMD